MKSSDEQDHLLQQQKFNDELAELKQQLDATRVSAKREAQHHRAMLNEHNTILNIAREAKSRLEKELAVANRQITQYEIKLRHLEEEKARFEFDAIQKSNFRSISSTLASPAQQANKAERIEANNSSENNTFLTSQCDDMKEEISSLKSQVLFYKQKQAAMENILHKAYKILRRVRFQWIEKNSLCPKDGDLVRVNDLESSEGIEITLQREIDWFHRHSDIFSTNESKASSIVDTHAAESVEDESYSRQITSMLSDETVIGGSENPVPHDESYRARQESNIYDQDILIDADKSNITKSTAAKSVDEIVPADTVHNVEIALKKVSAEEFLKNTRYMRFESAEPPDEELFEFTLQEVTHDLFTQKFVTNGVNSGAEIAENTH